MQQYTGLSEAIISHHNSTTYHIAPRLQLETSFVTIRPEDGEFIAETDEHIVDLAPIMVGSPDHLV